MSGMDEQVQDVPKCPKCGKIPQYWSVKVNDKSGLWFYSESYRMSSSVGKPYSDYKGEGFHKVLFEMQLRDMTSATCMGGCGYIFLSHDNSELFYSFYEFYKRYFPQEIYRTD